ncbi:MAG TPA: TIR domain-containing protein [Aggregatilineales bacterium]|nr:TIR domain-containing protein [Anaerolineales bacterium]HRE46929.1 TIR domain-containing protein [Aggregatilineales bacterium]
MNPETIREISDLLMPLCGGEEERRALFLAALGSRHPLLAQITFSGAVGDFLPNALDRAYAYGMVSEADERNALWVFLLTAAEQMGADKQARIAALKRAVNRIDAQPGDQVFLSYARKDKAFVDALITDLNQRGVKVWIDQRGLKPGTPDWEQAIRGAIQRSWGVLLVASPDSRRSSYVQDEIAIAEMYSRPLYPVWAVGEHWIDCIPMGLGKIQYVDMRGDAYRTGIEAIAAALRGRESTGEMPAAPPAAAETGGEPRNPYKGLRAFRAEDERDFFGRDGLIKTLMVRLEGERFVAVVGASGSGKSSLVMAGVMPALRRAHPDWIFIDPFVPGRHPLERTALAFSSVFPARSVKAILDDLDMSGGRGLHILAQNALKAPGGRVVLLIDQFEELFTLTATESERQRFIDLLTTALAEGNSPLNVILTLRADFYDRPLNYADLGRLVKDHSESILPFSLTDLKDAIERPAGQNDVQLIFDRGLVAELVFEVREQTGAMPLLQFTLDQLFQRREGRRLTRAAYDAIGGVRGALAKHAEATYLALPSDAHRALAHFLLLRLIEPGATEQDTTRRRANSADLVLTDGAASARLTEVRQAFTEARLLTADRVGEIETVEVSHEALIREWGRLKVWLSEGREGIRAQQIVAQDAAEWRRKGKRPDDLYRGSKLIDAQEWAKRGSASGLEAEFIAASEAAEQARAADEQGRIDQLRRMEVGARRTRQRLLITTVFAAVIIMAAILAAYLGFQGQQLAREQENTAKKAVAAAQDTSTAIAGVAATAEVKQATAEQKVRDAEIKAAEVEKKIAAADANLTRTEVLRLAALSDTVFAQGGNAATAALLAIRSLRTGSTSEGDLALQRALASLYTAKVFARTQSPFSPIGILAFSPDGQFALIQADSDLQLWAVEQGIKMGSFPLTTSTSPPQFSADGQFLVMGINDKVIFYRVQTGEAVKTFANPTHYTTNASYNYVVRYAALTADGKTLLTYSEDNAIRLWDVSAEKELPAWSQAVDGLSGVQLSPDGRYVLFILSNGDGMALHELTSGRLVRSYKPHRNTIYRAVFTPDGQGILTASADSTARLTDVYTGEVIQIFAGHSNDVLYAAISADGQNVLTGGLDKTVRLWETVSGKEIRRFTEHQAPVYRVAFSPDGRYALSGDQQGQVRLWATDKSQTVRQFTAESPVYSVDYSPDGRYVAAGMDGGDVVIWDTRTESVVRRWKADDVHLNEVRFSPDGRYLVTLNAGARNVILWDIATGKRQRDYGQYPREGWDIAFSPDGQYLAVGNLDGIAYLYDTMTGALLRTFAGHSKNVYGVALSPDGTSLVTVSADGRMILWEVASGKQLRIFEGDGVEILTVAFSPDGRYIVTGGGGGGNPAPRLWEVETGNTIRFFGDGVVRVNVTRVTFSTDGRYVLATTRDPDDPTRGYIYVWEVESGRLIRQLIGHRDFVNSARFSPEGLHIVSGGQDGTIRLWDTAVMGMVDYACSRLFGDLTKEELVTFGISDTTPSCPTFAAITDMTAAHPTATPLAQPWTPVPTALIPQTTPILPLPTWTPFTPTATFLPPATVTAALPPNTRLPVTVTRDASPLPTVTLDIPPVTATLNTAIPSPTLTPTPLPTNTSAPLPPLPTIFFPPTPTYEPTRTPRR